MMQAALRCSLVLLLMLGLGACSTIKGWFDSDEEVNPPAELVDFEETVDMRKLWSTGVGNGQGKGHYKLQPIIDGGAIYAAAADGEVMALDQERGKKIWKIDLETDLSGGVGKYESALFVGSSDGFVIKLDADTGTQLWSSRLQGEVLAAPQADGRVVIAQTYDGKIQGLDFESGEKLWTYDSNVPVLTMRGTSTPILRNDIVYAGFANGRVAAFNATDGGKLWEVRVAIPQGRSEIERIVEIDGTMVLAGNELYVASYQGRVVAIDVNNGRKIWQRDISSFSGVSQGFSNVYVADADGTLTAFLRSGQGERWVQSALSYRELSRPVPVSSYIAVADLEGIVHLVSQVDGEFAGRQKVDGKGVRADMMSDENILYVFGNSGKLVAYEIISED